MVNEARGGQDAFRQIECEYMLRKERRDIDELNEDVRRSRQALVDLLGRRGNKIRLDKQIAIETQTKADPKTEPPAEGNLLLRLIRPLNRSAARVPDKGTKKGNCPNAWVQSIDRLDDHLAMKKYRNG